MKKLIIDTDPGSDDALAIIYAAKSGCLDIKAITTVFGNLKIEETTKNALRILDILDDHSIPVYKGSERQLNGDLFEPSAESQKEGLGFYDEDPTGEIRDESAIDAILNIIEENPNEITLVAIGPLTNIARAYIESPETLSKVKEIIIMGGAINTRGNITPFAEYNIFCDPEAADVVFNMDVPKTLVPVNVCRKVVLTPEELDSFPESQQTDLIKKAVAAYVDHYVKKEGFGGGVMYDPLALGVFIDPDYVTKRVSLNVQVETEGKPRGMTAIDFSREKPNIEVCMDADAERFKKDFYRILLS